MNDEVKIQTFLLFYRAVFGDCRVFRAQSKSDNRLFCTPLLSSPDSVQADWLAVVWCEECCHVETQQNNKTLLRHTQFVPEPELGVVRLPGLQSAGPGGEAGREWAGAWQPGEAGDPAGGQRTRV